MLFEICWRQTTGVSFGLRSCVGEHRRVRALDHAQRPVWHLLPSPGASGSRRAVQPATGRELVGRAGGLQPTRGGETISRWFHNNP